MQFEMGMPSLNFLREKEISFLLFTRRMFGNNLRFYVDWCIALAKNDLIFGDKCYNPCGYVSWGQD